eukprot:TRINITY_DN6426_c0_g1_i1.p1 TRINITY_DN6426_c0_g1~~TRINITY_DN6426_c0_g1_i1.p1  ORF type:complete len:1208 (+),score=210.89 TRINITY_DN6426_c0_g1_i1:72-3695(+)
MPCTARTRRAALAYVLALCGGVGATPLAWYERTSAECARDIKNDVALGYHTAKQCRKHCADASDCTTVLWDAASGACTGVVCHTPVLVLPSQAALYGMACMPGHASSKAPTETFDDVADVCTCETLCTNTKQCRFWDYDRALRSCRLLGNAATTGIHPAAGVDFGVKMCVMDDDNLSTMSCREPTQTPALSMQPTNNVGGNETVVASPAPASPGPTAAPEDVPGPTAAPEDLPAGAPGVWKVTGASGEAAEVLFASTAALAMLTMNPSLMLAGQHIMLGLGTGCSSREGRDAFLPYYLNPLGLALGDTEYRYAEGALVGNTVLFVGVTLLHVAIVAVCSAATAHPQRGAPPVDAEAVNNSHPLMPIAAPHDDAVGTQRPSVWASRLRCPAVTILCFVVLLQGTVAGGTTLATSRGHGGLFVMGIAALAASVAGIGVIGWTLCDIMVHVVFPSDEDTPHGIGGWLLGYGEWTSAAASRAGVLPRFGVVFDRYFPHARHFLVYECLLSVVVPIVMVVHSTSLFMCGHQRMAVAVLMAIYTAVLFRLRPYARGAVNALAMVGYGLLSCGLALGAAGFYVAAQEGAPPEASGGKFEGSRYFCVAALVVLLCRAVMEAAVLVFVAVSGRRGRLARAMQRDERLRGTHEALDESDGSPQQELLPSAEEWPEPKHAHASGFFLPDPDGRRPSTASALSRREFLGAQDEAESLVIGPDGTYVELLDDDKRMRRASMWSNDQLQQSLIDHAADHAARTGVCSTVPNSPPVSASVADLADMSIMSACTVPPAARLKRGQSPRAPDKEAAAPEARSPSPSTPPPPAAPQAKTGRVWYSGGEPVVVASQDESPPQQVQNARTHDDLYSLDDPAGAARLRSVHSPDDSALPPRSRRHESAGEVSPYLPPSLRRGSGVAHTAGEGMARRRSSISTSTTTSMSPHGDRRGFRRGSLSRRHSFDRGEGASPSPSSSRRSIFGVKAAAAGEACLERRVSAIGCDTRSTPPPRGDDAATPRPGATPLSSPDVNGAHLPLRYAVLRDSKPSPLLDPPDSDAGASGPDRLPRRGSCQSVLDTGCRPPVHPASPAAGRGQKLRRCIVGDTPAHEDASPPTGPPVPSPAARMVRHGVRPLTEASLRSFIFPVDHTNGDPCSPSPSADPSKFAMSRGKPVRRDRKQSLADTLKESHGLSNASSARTQRLPSSIAGSGQTLRRASALSVHT